MSEDFLKPKGMSKSQLFEARAQDFKFRNPMGNEFIERGRVPDLPSGHERDPQMSVNRLKGHHRPTSTDRNKTYEKMFGTATSWAAKGRPL